MITLGEGALVGPYRLGRLLGRGGMAVVYEATHESIGRTVALKLVSPSLEDPDFVERFRREGRMQAALDHPNVVTVYEAGTSEYGPYLAMRLVRGTTLAHLVDDGLTTACTLRLVAQVADALDAAHASGLVHRDVKPRNVLVGEDDHAYLADFGLTRRSDAGAATVTGYFMGTLAYAAPEVLRGGVPGPAADRYALAAMLFECLTGTTVFPRPTHAAVVFAHTNEPPPRVSGRREHAPRALDEVLIAALSKDPAERPATAGALVERVRAALDGRELGPPPPRVPSVADDDDATTTGVSALPASATRRTARGRRRLGLVAVATAAALAGGGAVALLDRGEEGAAASEQLSQAVPGAVLLGSDLTAPGRTVDCRGQAVTDDSPSCTLFQERMTDATLVVPRDGVVRRWGVRSASGELALAVLRRRDAGYFQISRSRNEFVGSSSPYLFATDLAVEQGDRLGLVVAEGGAGMRGAEGATTGRWSPPLRGLIRPAQAGGAGELLLRVDYLPGGTHAQPEKLSGAAAAAAPAGEILARSRPRGASIEVRVVMAGSQGVLDIVRGGRRIARITIPDLRAPIGDTLEIHAGVEDPSSGQVGIDVRFTRPDSERLRRNYVVYTPGEGVTFID